MPVDFRNRADCRQTGMPRAGPLPTARALAGALAGALAVALAMAVMMGPALAPAGHAQQPKAKPQTEGKLKVRGVAVQPHGGFYVVLKDVNIRAKPETRSKRLGRLGKNRRVEAIGRAKGPWLAVRDGDTVLGFVYEPTLMPVIDGSLETPISGRITDGPAKGCDYLIEFLGKTRADNQRFEFADYEAKWSCRRGGKTLAFHTPMFLTEGPYQGTKKPIHQITVDLLELEGGLEEVFSTHLLWDRKKKQVRYDSVTMKKFAHAAPPPARPAASLAEALDHAVNIALAAWKPSVWTALAKRTETR